ncbi:MAG: hypothetical protein IJS60_02955 [Abditibacteriota bacterium]|nr:hypothetical protein [Abditibacteriota bacterium]
MKKIFIFLIFIIIVAGSAYADSTNRVRERLTPDEFIIMPFSDYWWSGTGEREKYYKDMFDCGFNVTHMCPPNEVLLAKKYKMKAQVYVRQTDNSEDDNKTKAKRWTQKIIDEVGKENMDNVYFVYLQDEPTDDEKNIAKLSVYADAVRENCKCKPYINLLPIIAYPYGGYDEYLDKLIKECSLEYISYDNYPFVVDNEEKEGWTNSNKNYCFNENSFYGNMEAVKAAADRNKVGFINIIQSVEAFNWPEPDDYIIHVQGWSTLAYGAKGLCYYTYQTPDFGDYRNAPYDEYNMKSPTWRYVAHMNYAIHNIGAIYKNLKHINVFHVGYVPKGCKDLSSAVNIKNLSLKSVKGEANAVVGEFVDKDGKQYAMIVNKNPNYSVEVSIEFKKGKDVYKIDDRGAGNQVTFFYGEGAMVAPGHGVLLFAE